MSKNTIEKRFSNKNGFLRMTFVAISMLFQLVLIALLFTSLSRLSTTIEAVSSVIAILIAIYIYARDKASAMKTPLILLLATFPIIGITIFFFVDFNASTKRINKHFKSIDEKLFPILKRDEDDIIDETSSISSYIYRNAGYPACHNTKVEYHADTLDSLNHLVEDISNAKKYVFMEYHAFENAKAWKMIEDVLVERVSHGVEVRIIYDDVGSISFIDSDFAKGLKEKGIKCRIFNPLNSIFRIYMNNRDHRKMTIIDGKIGYVGGYNIANEYFNFTHPYGTWKDSAIRMEGDAVTNLIVMFFEMWNALNSKEFEDCSKYINSNFETLGDCGTVQPYADMPMENALVGEDVYLNILGRASKYCYFMTPYFIISDNMARAIGLAAKRGVDVRIITPGIPDKKLVYSVTRSYYHDVAKDGAKVYEWTPGFVHAKMCVCDDNMATIGTINLDYRSLYHNFENGCFICGCDAVNDVKADFDKVISESREVTALYSKPLKLYQIVKKLILRIFSGLM
ncbi:MAG: cardiolipin synthase [Clostridia bacterium]|nr:cardiolipin synthase [Clostridia bacterium]